MAAQFPVAKITNIRNMVPKNSTIYLFIYIKRIKYSNFRNINSIILVHL